MIATATTMGPVYLTVADLDRTIDYWTREIGLELLERGADEALLGSGGRLLVAFREVPGAQPAPQSTGLFHVALLVPGARTWRAGSRTPSAIACSSPAPPTTSCPRRSTCATPTSTGSRSTPTGRAICGTAASRGWAPTRSTSRGCSASSTIRRRQTGSALPGGTIVGHTHLQVASIADTLAFYRDLLDSRRW